MFNAYQKQLMAQGFLVRLSECENNSQKEALVVELINEMLPTNHSPIVTKRQCVDAKELDGRFEFERRQE